MIGRWRGGGGSPAAATAAALDGVIWERSVMLIDWLYAEAAAAAAAADAAEWVFRSMGCTLEGELQGSR